MMILPIVENRLRNSKWNYFIHSKVGGDEQIIVELMVDTFLSFSMQIKLNK